MIAVVNDLMRAYFGDDIQTDTPEKDVTVGNSLTQIVNNNNRRVRLELTNPGPSTLTITRNQQTFGTTGELIAPGQTWEMNWLTGLDSTGDAINGVCVGVGSLIHVRETLLI